MATGKRCFMIGTMKNIVILISGRGSNMQAIVNARLPNVHIAAVISNNPEAAGLVWAKEHGITTEVVNHTHYPSREAFDADLRVCINRYTPDLIVLAGFMRIFTDAFTENYAGKMINIHPSLLPSFTGLHTHQRAIDMGCKIAGCTVHFVTATLDHGPIIAQAVVPVLAKDTEETLATRVLQMEHQIYPKAVADFVSGALSVNKLQVCNTRANPAPAGLVYG